jgi:uncharacterized OB-fold protein
MRDEDFFWEGAKEGRLLVHRCASCGQLRHPPAPMCSRCQSLEVEIIEASGRAKVLGWLVSKHPTRPDDKPRIVVRLQLEEGVYLIANLVGAELGEIAYETRVEVFFQAADGVVVPHCRLAAEVAA